MSTTHDGPMNTGATAPSAQCVLSFLSHSDHDVYFCPVCLQSLRALVRSLQNYSKGVEDSEGIDLVPELLVKECEELTVAVSCHTTDQFVAAEDPSARHRLPTRAGSRMSGRSNYPRKRGGIDLIGIEPNPGPTKKSKQPKRVTQVVKVVKTHAAPKRKGGGGKKTAQSTGARIGGSIGSWVGDLAQKAISVITGMGDYTVKENSLVVPGSTVPQFGANGRHQSTMCHREFLGLVTSPGSAFTTTSYTINPSTAAFPWLQQCAVNFELYRFRGLVFEFKATSATAVSSTNTALGSVILATQYNALAPPFISQIGMEAYEFCTSTVAFTSCIHPVECAPSQLGLTELYTDLGYAQGDPRFTTLGNLTVATVGQQAASVLGELWVSYEIDLIRPRLFGTIPSVGYTCRISGAFPSPMSSTDPFQQIANSIINNGNQTGLQVPAQQSLEIVVGSASQGTGTSGVITFPRGIVGSFLMTQYVQAATAAAVAYGTWSGTGGASLVSIFPPPSNVLTSPLTGVTSAVWTHRIAFTLSGTNGTAPPQMSYSTGANYPGGALSTNYLEIVQLNC